MPLAESRARAERGAYLRAVAGLSWSRIRDAPAARPVISPDFEAAAVTWQAGQH